MHGQQDPPASHRRASNATTAERVATATGRCAKYSPISPNSYSSLGKGSGSEVRLDLGMEAAISNDTPTAIGPMVVQL